MNKIKCPICKRMRGIYLEIERPLPDQEYGGIGIFCKLCGKIGESDIKIEMKDIRLDTAKFIKSNKEKIRKEFDDARRDWVQNGMGTW